MPLASEKRVTCLDPVFGSMGIEAGREIWGAREFSMREKALLLISADLAVPELGLPFELHVEMALTQARMRVEDLRELLRHVALYAGFNITAMAFEQLIKVVRVMGREVGSEAKRNPGPHQSPYSDDVRGRLAELDEGFSSQAEARSSEIWSRPGLSARERALSALAVDIVGGTLGAPFAAHVAIADRLGVPHAELRAMTRILAEFSMPRAWQALERLEALVQP